MARAPFTLTVTVPDAQGDLVPSVGAAVTIRRRSDSVLATSYTAETGGTGSTNALATDSVGRVKAWLERGAYRATISGGTPAVTSYDVEFEAAPAGDGTMDGAWLAATAVPIGVWLPYGGTTDPAGGSWLLCDGRALSRTTYAALFGVIGTTFGAGNGTSTFNLPNPAGRAIVGAGAGAGLTARGHGSTFGTETHALTAAELPAHTHDVANTIDYNAAPSFAGGAQGVGSKTTTSSSAGGGAAHPNVQPSLASNFVIRAL
jgi:microcystin-dependent protein